MGSSQFRLSNLKHLIRQRIDNALLTIFLCVLAERLKAANILSRGVVELGLIFQSGGVIDLQYSQVDEDVRAVQHEISKAFYDIGSLKKIKRNEEQHLSVPDLCRFTVRVNCWLDVNI